MSVFTRWTSNSRLIIALVLLAPIQLLAQHARVDISLVDGRIVRMNRPLLEVNQNPSWNPPSYRDSKEVFFNASEIVAFRWIDVAQIDYYPVDGGANCACIITFCDGSVLGIKGQLIFDLADERIANQLPSEVMASLRTVRWHSENKHLIVPSGLHHLEPYGERYPRVWDLFQCANYDDDSNDRPRIRSMVFVISEHSGSESIAQNESSLPISVPAASGN